MKNLILLLSLVIAGTATFIQNIIPKIQFKPNGLVGPDSTKNYIVIEVPKMTRADLFKKTLTYLNGIYNNPGKVISAVDGESIAVNGYTDAVKGRISFVSIQ